ncbi:hypothetical protein Tco_1393330 [Tanacetum coccineum]
MGVLPRLREDDLLENKPMAILERRLGKVNNKPIMFVLIQSTNKSVEEATWEIYGDLITRFPGFDAVNEVLILSGSSSTGSSSTASIVVLFDLANSMEPEVTEIADVPVVLSNQTPKLVSKSKGRGRQKKVIFHELNYVDIVEDGDDVVFIEGRGESDKKMKGAMETSLACGRSAI